MDRTKVEINELLEEKYNGNYKVYLNKCDKYQKQIDYLSEQVSLINSELKQKVFSYSNILFECLELKKKIV